MYKKDIRQDYEITDRLINNLVTIKIFKILLWAVSIFILAICAYILYTDIHILGREDSIICMAIMSTMLVLLIVGTRKLNAEILYNQHRLEGICIRTVMTEFLKHKNN